MSRLNCESAELGFSNLVDSIELYNNEYGCSYNHPIQLFDLSDDDSNNFIDDITSDPDTVESLLSQMSEKDPEQGAVFLVIGPTGHGKSTTLNTLFGMKYFKTSVDNSSTTIRPVMVPHPYNHNIRFIDTPGLFDIRGIDQDHQNINNVIDFCSQTPYNQPNCIILVLKFSSPFDGVMMEALDLVNRCCSLWETKVIIVFTFSTNQQIQMPDEILHDFYDYIEEGDNRLLARWKASRDYHERLAKKIFATDSVFFIDNDDFLDKKKLPDGTPFLHKFIQEGILPINVPLIGLTMCNYSKVTEVRKEAQIGMSKYLRNLMLGSIGTSSVVMSLGTTSIGMPISQAAPLLLKIGLAPSTTLTIGIVIGGSMATCGAIIVGGVVLFCSKNIWDKWVINNNNNNVEKKSSTNVKTHLLKNELEKRYKYV
jgi:energy-coupling factor transporter ATP-binding protein EcfA2